VAVDSNKEFTSTFYGIQSNQTPRDPTTKERNDLYIQKGASLAFQAAEKTLRASQIKPHEITHLITVSCTGFSNPGIDFALLQALNLPLHTQRYHLGFMGCCAAFPAMRMAKQFCIADPHAIVLIVCIELCTLHFQLKGNLDTILSNSLFSDGASAGLVSSKSPYANQSFYELGLSPLVGIEEIQLAAEIYLKRSGICPVERAKVGGIEVDSSTGSILFQVLREYVVPNPFEIKPGDAHRYES
jgi:predicted naringenin-chalcone synthase